jgi:hypothetical protein
MRQLILALALSLAASAAQAAACAPEKMMRIVTRNLTPGVNPDSFAGQPLTLYRQGARYMRTDEAPDRPQGLHLSIVIAEPDLWLVNRIDRSGKHMVDPGPTFEVHAPIVSGEGIPLELSELEFGCEADFVRSRAPQAVGRVRIGQVEASIHRLEIGEHRLDVAMGPDARPLRVTYERAGAPQLVVGYDAYETALPFDPKLFSRPEGFTYTEERGP